MNHHTQILIIQRKPPPKSTSKLPRGKGKGPNILATTFSHPHKVKFAFTCLPADNDICRQKQVAIDQHPKDCNAPLATPWNRSVKKSVPGGGIQTHLVMPRLPSSLATQVWVRKIPTSFFRIKMCRNTFHPNDTQ